MKRSLTLISAGLLVAAMAATGVAQEGPPTTPYRAHHQYVEGFDGYLDNHPDVRSELSAHPHLIDNPEYMAKHPELRDYMHDHPQAAATFRRHPDAFINREHVYNRSERRWDRRHGEHVDRN
jgi:hypothetical protein